MRGMNKYTVETELEKIKKGTEIWIWQQFNKTKPVTDVWEVTLSGDQYQLLIDAITTVSRDTGALLENGCPDNWTFRNSFYFVGV